MPFLVVRILDFIISALLLAIFLSVALSWARVLGMRVPYYHPVVQVIEQTADLIVRPIRRAIPTATGGIDFSPMVAMLVLYIVREVLHRLVLL